MKKGIFGLSLSFALLLVGCGGKGTNNSSVSSSTTSNSTSSTSTSSSSGYDLGGVDFRIVVNNALTADPRKDGYTGFFKAEKVAKIKQVEETYNIKVVYENYPSNASWGDARNRYIRESVAANKKIGHVFEVTNGYVPELVQNNAIAALDTYFEKYAPAEFYPEKNSFIRFNGKIYNYDDRYPTNQGGIYYNIDLLNSVGIKAEEMPAALWNSKNWNWTTFEALAMKLNDLLDETESEYVMGGRTYNWAQKLAPANGGYFVDSELNVGVNSKEVRETFEFLSKLYSYPGMWRDEAPLSNAIEPEFSAGKIVFHYGEGWYLGDVSKWADRNPKFNVGFVPYPTGLSTKADLSNYRTSSSFGFATFVIVKGYESVPAGFEKRLLSEELIFKIWNEMQHFGSSQEVLDEYYTDYVYKYIDDPDSRKANKSILKYSYSDYYSALGSAATGLVEGSYNIQIQSAIRGNTWRDALTSLEVVMKDKVTELYGKTFN
jgi:hypothetical protein